MSYREFTPAAELSRLVACTWERTVPPVGAAPVRVLPDGCVDLVWRAGDLFLAGPDTKAVMSPIGPGETVVGLRLRPGAAGGVLGLPASELVDTRPVLTAVLGRAGAEVAERVGTAGAPAHARGVLEDFVRVRLVEVGEPDELVLAATRLLGRPASRVGSLARVLPLGERQRLRRFKAAVGYGPKTLDRVLRFQRFLALAPAAGAGEVGLARAAAELGYADQAHLSRECLRLSGLTPSALAAGGA